METDPRAPHPKLHGRRRGRRLRSGRQQLLETVLPRFAITLPPPGGRLDPEHLFPRPVRAVWLEIGFGAGEHLAEQAQANPDVGLIGCEIFEGGIASFLRHAGTLGVDNVRLLADDARPLLDALPSASLERVFLLFPDPWPKARHADRRFVSDDRLDRLAALIVPGGELRIATDHPVYQRWTLEHMVRRTDFEWMARGPADWATRPDDWPPTRYEAKAIREGRRPIFLRYLRAGGTG